MLIKPNRQALRRLMTENDLKAPEVAAIVERAPQTIHLWCSKVGQDIPDDILSVLTKKFSGRGRANA